MGGLISLPRGILASCRMHDSSFCHQIELVLKSASLECLGPFDILHRLDRRWMPSFR